jgi:alkanesulfonate monooxygenase SsuD/methylene tetrahydromethanopterin reductase-like flavin-dependent oxidoreductase (luciferase family)
MAEVRHPLSFGVVIAQHQYTWPELVSQWKLAEELGFDSIWLFDHFMALYADPDGPCLETSTLLAALAQETSRAKIGVLVYGNTHRHPSVLAKEIVTVDHISKGRAILGIGAGWNEREHRAYGIPFPSAGDRVEMLDEALQIMESLFTKTRTTFHGAHYDLEDAPFSPKPVQEKLPVLIGGKRRDPGEIAVSSSFGADRLEHADGFEDLIRTYRAAGSSQFLFDFPLGGDGLESAKRLATDVIPRLRVELA